MHSDLTHSSNPIRDLLGMPAVCVGWIVGIAWAALLGYVLVLCYQPFLTMDHEAVHGIVAEHSTLLALTGAAGTMIVLCTIMFTLFMRSLDRL
jgi:hypothetical protein